MVVDNFIVSATLGYGATIISTFILYPYRDYVKMFNIKSIPQVEPISFSSARYRGMLQQPSQLLLIALPGGLLYTGFFFGGGSILGATLAGALHGVGKVGVRTIAYQCKRMHGSMLVSSKSPLGCMKYGVQHYGLLSFFSGASATILISTAWHGAALAMLQRSNSSGFGEAWWDAFRVHSFLAFVTAPLRNTFRSSLYSRKRSGGVHGFPTFVAGEVAIFQEAWGVFHNMLRTEGIPFFLNGVMRTALKASLPFGFTFAMFSLLGGSLPGGNGGQMNDHRHRHMLTRRFT
uniref:Mitochondrial carrier protein n=1 Tax=Trypanosoma congolense (strain IL3000) TaxID=1068625 RepID=G0UW27_TRYCI|nr:conserved hypothetical protein [Trypanosoma congolense IL3000]